MTKTCQHCHATVHSTSQPERVTDEMLNAHIKALGDWTEPFTAERESGVAMDMDISQEDADQFNADERARLRIGYTAALAAAPAVDATQGALALYLNEVQPVDGRVQINVSIDELTVLRHLAGATPAVGGEREALHRIMDTTNGVDSSAVCWLRLEKIRNLATDALAAQPASPLRGITDKMLNAHLKATSEWVDPYEAATECGVPIECGITQQDADELNAQSRASLRVGYAAALASPPEQPAAYPSAEADKEHADLLRRLAAVPKEEK